MQETDIFLRTNDWKLTAVCSWAHMMLKYFLALSVFVW